jgi:hypothetical protein
MAHGKTHEHAPGASHEPVVHDPEHDIDARSATIWVIAGSVVLFFSLWVLIPIFVRVLEQERETKIYSAPTTELLDVKKDELAFLNGGNPTKKDIQQVVQSLRR